MLVRIVCTNAVKNHKPNLQIANPIHFNRNEIVTIQAVELPKTNDHVFIISLMLQVNL